jgi:hypothetical protein
VKQPALRVATAVRVAVERRGLMESYSAECVRPLLQMVRVHTVFILCSYCVHTVFILCSYCVHTVDPPYLLSF